MMVFIRRTKKVRFEEEKMMYIKIQHQIFSRIWRMYREHYNASTDDEWGNLVGEAEMLLESFPDEFTQDLVFAVINELERRFKERKTL